MLDLFGPIIKTTFVLYLLLSVAIFEKSSLILCILVSSGIIANFNFATVSSYALPKNSQSFFPLYQEREDPNAYSNPFLLTANFSYCCDWEKSVLLISHPPKPIVTINPQSVATFSLVLCSPNLNGLSTSTIVSQAKIIESSTAKIRILRAGIPFSTILAKDSSGQCQR